MKAFTLVSVASLVAITVMAAPDLSARQNDIKKCKDGVQGPSGGYDKRENDPSPLDAAQRMKCG